MNPDLKIDLLMPELFSRPVYGPDGLVGDVGLDDATVENFDPDEPRDRAGKWTDGGTSGAGVPKGEGGSVVARIKAKIAAKYAALEARYGRRGALAVLAGMAVAAPVPIPGAALVPAAIAEGVLAAKRGIGKLTGNADGHDVDTLVAEAISLLRELYAGSDEEVPEIDEAKVRVAVEASLAEGTEETHNAETAPGLWARVRSAVGLR